jgi:hypothetical protein
MTTLEEIQSAVMALSAAQQYEFSIWLLHEMENVPLTEELTDAIALDRFQALDAEERDDAPGATR